MSSFDVWVLRFDAGDVPPADRLARAFGLDQTTARSLASNLPRVVKHGVAARHAGEMRKLLESIGAEVECRPAGRTQGETNPRGAVFQRPDEAPFADRVSAIDPFSPASGAGVPRISVDGPSGSEPSKVQSEISGVARPPGAALPRSGLPPRSVDDAIRARALAQQKKTFVRRAVGAIVSGFILALIGLLIGNSVFLGSADWLGVGVDGLAIYFLGTGGYDLYTSLRS